MQFLVIQRSYMPSFMIVRLQISEIQRKQKNQAACTCGATRPKIKIPLSPCTSTSLRGPTCQVSLSCDFKLRRLSADKQTDRQTDKPTMGFISIDLLYLQDNQVVGGQTTVPLCKMTTETVDGTITRARVLHATLVAKLQVSGHGCRSLIKY